MKLFLNIESGSLAGRNFELTSGFLTIGRGERCTVRFDAISERVASKEHCFIEARADGFYITDNSSTNGTIVNTVRVQSSKLNSGDIIQFGKNGVTARVSIQPTAAAVPEMASAETNLRSVPSPVNATQPFIASATPLSYSASAIPDVSFQQPVFAAPSQNLRNSLQSLGVGSLPPGYVSGIEEETPRNYFVIAAVILGIVFLSLVVGLLITTSLSSNAEEGFQLTFEGVVTAVMASFVAFIPGMFYLLPLVWLDRYDPEPAWLLALAFAWGALVAVIASFIINTVLGALFGPAVGAVFSAPVFEEGSKGIGLLIVLLFFRRYFDDILDGIVFAGVIALGFATVENVLYYGRGITTGGGAGLAVLFVIRGVMSPFAHVTFTAMTGIGCGISRESHNLAIRLLAPLVGYGCAVALHAIWNGSAMFGGGSGFFLTYLLFQIPFFFIFVSFSFYIMYRQNKILKEMLAIDSARGLIPADHLKKATSAFSSTAWLFGGLLSGKFRARSNYLRALGKLGLSYWHIQRATAAQGQTASFQQNPILRAEVVKWQPRVD